ncbi:MAG: hypothetical protein M0D53_01530 [Flavobacterium sp. JAD_PAG50586_2]|nr:MAG: hypothetical protein M0D53_01530 [Flavobacterium sp. JAD_PAG50586_2]
MMISSMTLHPIVKVADESMIGKGLKALELSHKSCLILNSVKSEILFMPHVECETDSIITSDEHHNIR